MCHNCNALSSTHLKPSKSALRTMDPFAVRAAPAARASGTDAGATTSNAANVGSIERSPVSSKPTAHAAALDSGSAPSLSDGDDADSGHKVGVGKVGAHPEDDDAVAAMLIFLSLQVDAECQMQKLAAAHFASWHFWFLFLPPSALTMVIGILAFLATAEGIEEDAHVQLSIVVGCLALVSVFLQALNDQLAYGARAGMHKSAVLDLKPITDKLKFKQIDRLRSASPATGMEECRQIYKLYSQVEKGCKSAIPLRVSQAFASIESRLMIEFPSNRNVRLLGRIDEGDVLHVALTELHCVIAAYWLFPFVFPDPHRTVSTVLDRLYAKFSSDVSGCRDSGSKRISCCNARRIRPTAPEATGSTIGDLLLMRERLPQPGSRDHRPHVLTDMSNVVTACV